MTSHPVPRRPRPLARLAAVIALILGLGSAVVSASWALGFELGLDLLGGELADRVRQESPQTRIGLWTIAAAKTAGALLGPAVISDRRLPRRVRAALTATTYAAGVLLAGYGGLMTAAQGLVVSGIIPADEDADRSAILGHLLLWDPWFLAWGVALVLAAHGRPRS